MTQIFVFAQSPHPIPWSPRSGKTLIAAFRGFTWQSGGYSCSCLRLLSGGDALMVQSFDAWKYALLN